MADIQTKPTDVSPASFIAKLDDDRTRRDCRELIAMMKEITGKPAKMWGPAIIGFGQYHYKYESGREGDMCMTGFSPRKANLTLYVGAGLEDPKLLSNLGKFKTAKSCLYFKSLDDVDRSVLRLVIKKAVAEMRKRYPCE